MTEVTKEIEERASMKAYSRQLASLIEGWNQEFGHSEALERLASAKRMIDKSLDEAPAEKPKLYRWEIELEALFCKSQTVDVVAETEEEAIEMAEGMIEDLDWDDEPEELYESSVLSIQRLEEYREAKIR